MMTPKEYWVPCITLTPEESEEWERRRGGRNIYLADDNGWPIPENEEEEMGRRIHYLSPSSACGRDMLSVGPGEGGSLHGDRVTCPDCRRAMMDKTRQRAEIKRQADEDRREKIGAIKNWALNMAVGLACVGAFALVLAGAVWSVTVAPVAALILVASPALALIAYYAGRDLREYRPWRGWFKG